ncbi:MAG: ABC transporter [Bacillota bacterium]
MKFLRVLCSDVRYQFKYGFYFLYAVMVAVYFAILLLIPTPAKPFAAALIIWSDPAGLGFAFIGGIVLLERGEGLHSYLSVTPVTPAEYVLAKALSLSLVSTLAGLAIAALGLDGGVDYPLMATALVLGSSVFTLFGLAVGTMARSLNHYLVLSILAGFVLMGPALFTLFGASNPLLEALPSTLLLRSLQGAVGLDMPYSTAVPGVGLVLWLLASLRLATGRFAHYLQETGGH